MIAQDDVTSKLSLCGEDDASVAEIDPRFMSLMRGSDTGRLMAGHAIIITCLASFPETIRSCNNPTEQFPDAKLNTNNNKIKYNVHGSLQIRAKRQQYFQQAAVAKKMTYII